VFYYFYMKIAEHKWLPGWFSGEGMFTSPLFRAVLAALLAFFVVLLSGNKVIRWLMKQKVGDNPEFNNKTLNELTKHKGNTPTMGGLLIMAAILGACLLVANMKNFYVIMALFCLVYLACLGAVDDWLKLTTARRTPGSRDGLLAWEKLVFQVGLGTILAMFIFYHASNVHEAERHRTPPTTGSVLRGSTSVGVAAVPATTAASAVSRPIEGQELNWPFMRNIVLPVWLFAMLTIVVITGTSNAVNLTDGMDGLAGGCMVVVSLAFMALSYVTGDQRWAANVGLHYVSGTGELAVVCGAITGACLGFLWYNCNPAQVFMGDTGSLALGGVMGYVAIVIRQEPMLLLVGGIFVVEALSVIMQVSYFRMTGGKRIFLCSPIHHHFHLKGWSEQQVVVRFWLISALCAAVGLAMVKLG
jgi:phospho-N-acetylmuramoyl-pentapeptide-transferase